METTTERKARIVAGTDEKEVYSDRVPYCCADWYAATLAVPEGSAIGRKSQPAWPIGSVNLFMVFCPFCGSEWAEFA